MSNDSKVKLVCKDCGTEFELRYGWVKKFSEDHHWRCKSCRINYHKNWYKNMSSEKKALVSKKMSKSAKQRWNNMSTNEYENLCKLMSYGSQLYWKNLSNEDYNIRCQINQKIWNNMSYEQRVQHANNISKSQILRWENMSDDEYDKMCKILSKTAKSYWDNISDEELEKRKIMTSERFKMYWKNMTQEEYDAWQKKRVTGFNLYLMNLQRNPNQNESDLINYLKIYDIDWIYQYFNTQIHPDFHNLFPRNPIFNSNNVVPFHSWDFKLNFLNHKSILVDIDGSIHDSDKTNYDVTYYTGEKFKLCDYIKFNDSQRPYQTDDLDAYVIQCYDDKLTLDTNVINIMTMKTMSLYMFLNLISSYNISDSKLKKICK